MVFVQFTVENESHCDFVKLREMLIRTNMEDMREKTHMKHYELYRRKRLEQVSIKYLSFDSQFEHLSLLSFVAFQNCCCSDISNLRIIFFKFLILKSVLVFRWDSVTLTAIINQ